MGQPLSKSEIEWAKAYIIWRSVLKALKKDHARLHTIDFALISVYQDFLDRSIHRVEKELAHLSRLTIRVNATDQPTVWEVKIGTHQGYIEVNLIEMMLEFKKLMLS